MGDMRAGLGVTLVGLVSSLAYCADPEEGETPRAEAIKANFAKLVSEDKAVKRKALLYFGKVDFTFFLQVPLFTASLKDERNQVRAI
jgi:uracil-DNA glycosylase